MLNDRCKDLSFLSGSNHFNWGKCLKHLVFIVAFLAPAISLVQAGQTYTLGDDGVIRALVDDNCSVNDCTWTELDRNPATDSIVADESGLYQMHNSGAIWRFTGRPCDADFCYGWVQLDNNVRTKQIVVADGQLYQRHDNGSIYRFTGQACRGNVCSGWQKLDNNWNTVDIVAGGDQLYQRHRNGRIYQYTGTPCSGSSCPGWQMLDRNALTIELAATDNKLYQRHSNGAIWEYTGSPCVGLSCTGWRLLDNNSNTVQLTASRNELFQRHQGGSIYRYTGTPCSGSRCYGWERLDRNPHTKDISAADDGLIQTHDNGSVWLYTGAPCDGSVCIGWKMINRDSSLASAHLFSGDALLSEDVNDTALARKTGYLMRPLFGTRPLLLIVADVRRANGTRQFTLEPTDTYSQLVFGGHESGLSVVDYFSSSSENAFRFSNAGTARVSLQGDSITPNDFIRAASRSGIDFSNFDRNNDNRVTYDELNVLVIDNITRGWGATRGACRTVNSVEVCLPVSLAGGQSIFANFVHEVAHALYNPTPADLYGSGCFLQDVGILGHCTAFANPVMFDDESVDFSPWNKSRFGWTKPDIQYANMKGSCRALNASSYRFAQDQSMLLMDPTRSEKEYYMFEHRNNVQLANFHPYDRTFIGKGVVPYYINWTRDNESNIITNADGSQDRSVLMTTDPLSQRRMNVLSSRSTPLKYFDGEEVGVRVRSMYKSPLDEIVSYMEWDRGVPLRPRIQSVTRGGAGLPVYTGYHGTRLTLRGDFGLTSHSRSTYLVNNGQKFRVYPYNWSCDQMTFTIPSSVPRGETYDLVMTHRDWDTSHTLDVKVRVR
ncbi:hypothetical protein [Pleionea sediminis]|uniref:hypothetical protein n=1 Tax=Pleionea sediminis TaxID=2569479 RepID=UPI00118549EA|nr:hypothetical protein [Pleionea sediminis]